MEGHRCAPMGDDRHDARSVVDPRYALTRESGQIARIVEDLHIALMKKKRLSV